MSATPDTTQSLLQAESLRQQVAEYSEIMRQFFELRFRVMTRFALTVGAIVLAGQWLIEEDKPLSLKLLLAGGGCLFSLLTALLDRVHSQVIRTCYAKGKDVEDRLDTADVGLFHSLSDVFTGPTRLRFSYGHLLRSVYVGFAIVFLATGVLITVSAG